MLGVGKKYLKHIVEIISRWGVCVLLWHMESGGGMYGNN